MIKNYLTFTLRYISRNKTFTFINVLGLAIGMMACILIMQYVAHEFSYDDFHVKKDRIFRIQQDRYDNGELSTRWAAGCSGIGPDLKTNFPEVERYVRLRTAGAPAMSATGAYFKEDAVYKENSIYYSSEDFFQIFSVKLIAGESSSVLKDPFKIVLSKSLAKKYFGQEDPIGKILRMSGKVDFQVTGVFEDLPVNTHMKIDALMSFSTLQKWSGDAMMSWFWDGYLTYILLDEKTEAKTLESKLPSFVDKQVGEPMKNANAGMTFHLQPITSIHLDSDFIGEFKPNGNRQSAYFLSIVAVLILAIAWINYINLSTAKSIERAREVGVRKVMGGFRSQLIQQFLFESVLLNTTAVVASIVAVILLTQTFSEFTGRELGYVLFRQTSFWIGIGVVIFGGALLSGLYPAFVLSSYRPAEVVKGRFKNTSSGVLFRKGMVVVQFISAITFVIGTFAVYMQMRFMQDQELGVNIDQTLVVETPDVRDSLYVRKFEVFRQKVEQYPDVLSVAQSSEVPGREPNFNAGGVRIVSQQPADGQQYRVIFSDQKYQNAYGLKVIAGRGFIGEEANDRRSVMLNEAAVNLMGFMKPEDAIDVNIIFWNDTLRIVGVLKNYHQETLKKAFDPTLFRYHPHSMGYYSIKLKTSTQKATVSAIEKEWKEMFPGNPFNPFFLDDHYDLQYQADHRFGKVFGSFSSLAIFIACLGLFGLSSLTVIQRTKEIGVRKVLGASIPSIVATVSKDVLLLMVVAIVLSIPFAWWIISEWLSDFAFRISLTWWIFAIPGFAVAAIAMLIVSIHTIKAARISPVKSLRYE